MIKPKKIKIKKHLSYLIFYINQLMKEGTHA